MKAEEFMTPSPRVCHPWDSLQRAAEQMWNGDCGCLPVVDQEDRIVGMITDRDICMAGLLQDRALRHLRVADSMSREIFRCRTSDPIERAAELMRKVQIHRVPVVDADGRLQGMISTSDLIRTSGKRTGKGMTATAVLETLASIVRSRNAEDTPVDLREIAAPPRKGPKPKTAKKKAGKRAKKASTKPSKA